MTEIEFPSAESLRKIVTTLNRVVPTSAREDYRLHLLFDTNRIVATNGDVIIEISLPDIMSDVRFPFAISSSVLANSVDLCGSDAVIRHTEVNDTHAETCKLISGSNEFVIPIYKGGTESLKKLAIVDRNTYKLKCSFSDLASIMKYAYPHVSTQIEKQMGFNGMHFISSGQQVRCVGADGKTLAWSYAEITEPQDVSEFPGKSDIKLLSGGVLVPRESAAIICDLYSTFKDFECEFSCDSSRWIMRLKHVKGSGTLRLSGSTIEMPYPKIMKFIKREQEQYDAEQVLYVATKELSEKIKKVSLFSGDDTKRVDFNINKKDSTIRLSSYGKGRADVIIPMDKLSFVSEDFHMMCDPNHILACLGSIKTENVQLRCDMPKHRVFIFDDNAVANPDTGMLLSLFIPKKAG